jgi:hypothetical protein
MQHAARYTPEVQNTQEEEGIETPPPLPNAVFLAVVCDLPSWHLALAFGMMAVAVAC